MISREAPLQGSAPEADAEAEGGAAQRATQRMVPFFHEPLAEFEGIDIRRVRQK